MAKKKIVTTSGKKGPKCTVCAHPKLKEINKALVGPNPNFSAIARIYGLHRDNVRRHLEKGHIEEKIQKSAAAQEALEADDLLGEIFEIKKITRYLINQSIRKTIKVEKGGELVEIPNPDYNPRLAVPLLARRESQIELQGKIMGPLKEKPGEVDLLGTRELLIGRLASIADRRPKKGDS